VWLCWADLLFSLPTDLGTLLNRPAHQLQLVARHAQPTDILLVLPRPLCLTVADPSREIAVACE
jgi:hypothetical protein